MSLHPDDHGRLRLHTLADCLSYLRRSTGIDELPHHAAVLTLPQALAHCAQSIEYSMLGFPSSKPRLYQKTIGATAKRFFLFRGAMSHDLSKAIPGAPAIARDMTRALAEQRLVEAVRRFEAFSGACAPHFTYGPTTKREYEVLHAIHLADHLASFAPALTGALTST